MNITNYELHFLIRDSLDIYADFMRLDATAHEIATSGLTPRGADYRNSTKGDMARSLATHLHGYRDGLGIAPSHFRALIERFGLRPAKGLYADAGGNGTLSHDVRKYMEEVQA